MSIYVERSLANNAMVSDSCQDAFVSIRELDELQTQLAAYVDSQLEEEIEGSPKQKRIKDKSKAKSKEKNKGKGAALDFDSLMKVREVIEDLSARKSALAVDAYDMIDQATRAVDEDVKFVELSMEQAGHAIQPLYDVYTGVKASDSCGGISLVGASEPVYCICNQVAFGEMISCDNEDCTIEWFHYACVGLTKEPRGSAWYCPICAQNHKRARPRKR